MNATLNESQFLATSSYVNNPDEAHQSQLISQKVRKEQLETLTSCQLTKKLNDDTYNDVIDKCNDADQEIANFFQAVAENDLEKVQGFINTNPLIAYEVNERMQTALHLAVLYKHFEMAEIFLEKDYSQVLLKAVDMKRMTPLDLAKHTK